MSYSAGHPWYYVLGGAVPCPKEIRAHVRLRGYRGYRDHDIAAIDKMAEPKRSEALRRIRAKAVTSLNDNISIYRRYARELSAYRRSLSEDATPECAPVHTSLSLKYAHIYNDLAHIDYANELLAQQRDLFD